MRLAGADRDSIEKPEAYLFSIASNLLRDRARRQRVRDGIQSEIRQMPDLGIELLDPHRVAEGQDMQRALCGTRRAPREDAADLHPLPHRKCCQEDDRRAIRARGIVDRQICRARDGLSDRQTGEGDMSEGDPSISPIGEAAGDWCRRIAEQTLSPDELLEFEAWLDADDAHRAAFERASFIWRALDGRAAPRELVAMRMDALSALAGQDEEPLPWWKRPIGRRTGFGALAASLVAALTFALYSPMPVAQATDYATARGERRVVMLDDGSRLSMDAASNVSVAYSKDRRELELKSGRAKFDVAKDPLKPFTVAAGDKLIVATGTSFSVEILKGEVNVVLFEGHVAVLDRKTRKPAVVPSHGKLDAADALLKPGQELSLPAAGNATLASVDVARATSWEAGQLSFADEPLSQAVERMNRYSKVRFAVGDAAAGRIAISGTFNSDNVDAFVDGVTDVFPVKTVRRGDEIAFVTRP